MHAWWNFIYKRAHGDQVFIGWSKVAEAVLFLPVFVVMLMLHPVDLRVLLPLAVVGAALTGANYVFLGLAYSRGDLSVIYPLSRAGILLFLPVLAWLFTRQGISVIGGCAITLVILGAFMLQLPVDTSLERGSFRRLLSSSGTFFALAAAFSAACYTLWDKHAVRQVAAFTYFYLYTVFNAAAYFLWMLKTRPQPVAYLRAKASPIVQVGVLNTVAYLLVLLALRDSNPSYVVATRLLSIGIGAVLGWKLLHEPHNARKLAGAAILMTGCALVALA
jgi:drug/metabolite transporter (DMT)-like permease